MEARRILVSVPLSPQNVRCSTIVIGSGTSENGKVIIDIIQIGAYRKHGVPVGLGPAVPLRGEEIGKVAKRINPHRLAVYYTFRNTLVSDGQKSHFLLCCTHSDFMLSLMVTLKANCFAGSLPTGHSPSTSPNGSISGISTMW
jgi:hypothetical protein